MCLKTISKPLNKVFYFFRLENRRSQGPFWVLVGAQMPSILVELGYISHPEEGRRLYEKDYQQLLANGIANGVDSYFSKNP